MPSQLELNFSGLTLYTSAPVALDLDGTIEIDPSCGTWTKELFAFAWGKVSIQNIRKVVVPEDTLREQVTHYTITSEYGLCGSLFYISPYPPPAA